MINGYWWNSNALMSYHYNQTSTNYTDLRVLATVAMIKTSYVGA